MNLLAYFALVLFTSFQITNQVPEVKLPAGFEILPYADDSLASDIYCLSISPKGDVCVSGKGYFRILIDTDNDGKADTFKNFGQAPSDGATGLLFEKKSLWYTGNQGLWSIPIAEDGVTAAGPGVKHLSFKTGGEHEAHAIKRGPDGLIYILCGNITGINSSFAMVESSPVKKPLAGTVIKYDPENKKTEVFVDGLRNPYCFDFNLDGELFTFDSDNERCIALPWYEPTRIYHLVSGGRYGWWNPQQSETWRSPPSHADILPPIATAGRGSPTGVLCYKGTHFPAKYQGSLFILDWTFGRILTCELKPKDSSFSTKAEVFLEPKGNAGFAPTAVDMNSLTGELFVCIGGRGTKGSVFRIRHQTNPISASALPYKLKIITTDKALITATSSSDLLQRRKAIEFLRFDTALTPESINKIFSANADHPDRFIRYATTKLIESHEGLNIKPTNVIAANTLGLAQVKVQPSNTGIIALENVMNLKASFATRLDSVRIMQMALGELPNISQRGNYREGYSIKPFKESWIPTLEQMKLLALSYPSGDSDLDFELERTFGLMKFNDKKNSSLLLDQLTLSHDPVRKIHLLASIAQTGSPFSDAQKTKVINTMLNLGTELDLKGMKRDRNWPLRMQEIFADLCKNNNNFSTLVANADTFGMPDHAIYLRDMKEEKKNAAKKFALKMLGKPDLAWNAQSVRVLELLPPQESFPAIRVLWGEHGLDEILIKILAKNPMREDLQKFATILRQISNDDLPDILYALEKLAPLSDKEYLLLAQKLPNLPSEPKYKALQEQVFSLLRKKWTTAPATNQIQDWIIWAKANDVKLLASLTMSGGISLDQWKTRFEKIIWDEGDISKGKKTFTQLKCASCHSGSQALGPALEGVTQRFSRFDLLNAIIHPDKDVPNRYRAVAYTTIKGKIILGLVVYESADGVLLQTSTGEPQRLSGDEISLRQQTQRSIMPAGLLDEAKDEEIANLFAYMKSLGKTGK